MHAHTHMFTSPRKGWRLSPATTACKGEGSPTRPCMHSYPPSTETSLERTRSLLFPTMMTGRSWWGLPARSLRRVSGTLEKLLRSVTEKTMRKASPVWRQWSLIHPRVSSCRWAGSPGESGQRSVRHKGEEALLLPQLGLHSESERDRKTDTETQSTSPGGEDWRHSLRLV